MVRLETTNRLLSHCIQMPNALPLMYCIAVYWATHTHHRWADPVDQRDSVGTNTSSSDTTMSARKSKQKKAKKNDNECLFCLKPDSVSFKYGKLYKWHDIYVHYYCLLLSSGLTQRGRDDEGICGFLPDDIRKEKKRGEKLKCSYCRKNGATIGCYCAKHRPRQELNNPDEEKNDECPTCGDPVVFDEGLSVLQTPCCDKLVHRICLQKQALSAGYYHYKCPLCNSGQEFKEMMTIHGIYIPKEDASWEREENGFAALYQRHSRCDQEVCLCAQGRAHASDTRQWQLLICDTCGSRGAHWTCLGRAEYVDAWVCADCAAVDRRVKAAAKEAEERRLQSEKASKASAGDGVELISDAESKSSAGSGLKRRSRHASSGGSPPKRVRRHVQMIDTGVQCELAEPDDLVDCDPIERLEPYVVKRPAIAVIQPTGDREVIEVDDSDDDDCVLLD
ncbi:unnamed protein product [Oppiella nova]|uniref:PHD-type domain-containing protein n=1 Tax=Oppiella nova TaxID=334625 RepID=A0A7R9LG06_9ACAR|nr:unnamed protein product [Oppiella nova]CAG2163188.1 unnamed protein product [Oppiella nova]